MLVAADSMGNQVLAWRTQGGDYFCPECEQPVFIKDGPLKITHFSHYASTSCGYGQGEGPRHMAMKLAVMKMFESLPDVEFEKCVISGRRADVAAPTAKVVVECQVSPMRVGEWENRTAEYSDAGYSVLWVWDEQRLHGEYIPQELLFCHRICYGQITVYSLEDETWYSVHLDSRDDQGWYLGKRRRRVFYREMPEEIKVHLLRSFNEDLRTVNLVRPWWTKNGVAK